MTKERPDDVAAQLGGALQRMQRGAARHRSEHLARRAALRLADRGRFGSSARADAQLLRFISFAGDEPPPLSERLERLLDDAMLVAYLVASTGVVVRDPNDRHASFGRDLRALPAKYANAVERLMRSVLGADREDLPGLLRSGVSLLASANQLLAADALVRDLGGWDRDDQRVQKRWSYDLWAQSGARDQLDETSTEETLS